MTAAQQRNRLLNYLAGADDKKVKGLYSLLKEYIDGDSKPTFTQQQLEILDERRASFLSGKNTGIDWQTMHNNIREKRKASK